MTPNKKNLSALPVPPLRLSLTMIGLGAVLYHIGFFQRVAPAVLTTELTLDFSLSATALGNLSAIYFYSYVAMQVPTGLLADRWGPRKLLAMGACIASFGGAVFAMAPDVWWASVGRLLVGGAVAVAFVGIEAVIAGDADQVIDVVALTPAQHLPATEAGIGT